MKKVAYFTIIILLILGFTVVTINYDLNPFLLFLSLLAMGFISQWAFKRFLEDGQDYKRMDRIR